MTEMKRFRITTKLNGKTIEHMRPIDDPFIYTKIFVGWQDLLKSLLRGKSMVIEVAIDSDTTMIREIMETIQNAPEHIQSQRGYNHGTYESHGI